MGRIVLGLWTVTVAVSYVAFGEWLGRMIEGVDRISISWVPFYVTLALLIVSLGTTAKWSFGRLRESRTISRREEPGPSGRRRFLLGLAAAVGGVTATGAAVVARNYRWFDVTAKNIFLVRPPYKSDVARPEWAGSRVRAYRRLGRTGVEVSDISLGSGSSTGGRQTVRVIREAIERGINYIDTAPDYSLLGSEARIGEAVAGVRDEVFLATKFCLPSGHLGPGASVHDYMEAVNGSLRRLETDRVELVHIHACDSVERLLDENAHEAFDRLKEQGKARFLGVSTHTPNLESVANAAIDSDRFDVMMLAYHFGAWPNLASILDRAAQQDIGVVAMKTLRGSLHEGLDWSRDERDSFTQASFRWVLDNPSVSCLVISLWDSGQLDEFLYASGASLGRSDVAVLERYQELTSQVSCRSHCGLCLDRCPEEVPIHDVLRHKMYFEGLGAQKEAMRLYSELEVKADRCAACSAPCAGACPYGISIADQTREAHSLLTIG